MLEFFSSAFFASVFAVVLAFLGTNTVQHRLHRRSLRLDEFRQMLIEFTMILSKYWAGSHDSDAERRGLEAEIKVRQSIVLAEFRSLGKKYRVVRKIQDNYYSRFRRKAVRNATLGRYEAVSGKWKPDYQKAQAATKVVVQILHALPR